VLTIAAAAAFQKCILCASPVGFKIYLCVCLFDCASLRLSVSSNCVAVYLCICFPVLYTRFCNLCGYILLGVYSEGKGSCGIKKQSVTRVVLSETPVCRGDKNPPTGFLAFSRFAMPIHRLTYSKIA
jgi:hypothetical protein